MERRTVRDVMLSDPVMVSPDETLGEVSRRIRESGQQVIPVVDRNNELCGVISDRDLRLAADSPLLEEASEESFERLQQHTVGAIMTTAVHSIESDAPIVEAAQLMRVANVSGLPVVEFDETGNHEHLVGLVTRSALLDYLILLLEGDT